MLIILKISYIDNLFTGALNEKQIGEVFFLQITWITFSCQLPLTSVGAKRVKSTITWDQGAKIHQPYWLIPDIHSIKLDS